ncbi:MAG: DUF5916 domain-containing protein [Bacteroidota bacterium]
MQAERISERPKIDGRLTEAVWQDNPHVQTRFFTQNRPDNGQASSQQTQLHILYSDEAIYVGARMFDSSPDSILRELGLRDEFGKNTDMFAVFFDPYLNRQNAFGFFVSAAGVQADSYITPDDWDENWNAVWESAVSIHDEGWTVEMEIPYGALRFPKKAVQDWGFNVQRRIRRKRERSHWYPVDANVNGFVNQFGTLQGLTDIKPPLRLSITPYVSGYLQKNGEEAWGTSITGGMDLKFGISESFTLDMSLIPDFGQVISDNVVLNLGPFEVRFDENRPFFTEGTELFNKGGLFYSRRVGQSYGMVEEIDDGEEIIEARPSTAPLVNATKVSGRTAGGLGIGFFNAVTDRSYAIVQDTMTGEQRKVLADPLTNFNVMVVDQNLRNNSNITLINTNVTRSNGGRSANVTGTEFAFFDKSNTWNLSGFGAVSQVYGSNETGNDVGFAYEISGGKVSGQWQFNVAQRVETDNYNINDLGFLRAPNEVSAEAEVSWQRNEPFGAFNRIRTEVNAEYVRTWAPNEFDNFGLSWNGNLQTRNFWSFGWGLGGSPVEQINHFEAREPGYVFRKPSSHRLFLWASTDSRKPFFIRANGGVWQRPSWNQVDNWFTISPRFRFSNNLTVDYEVNAMWRRRELGYVTKWYTEAGDLDQILMGRRGVKNLTNLLGVNYTFNDMMGLSLRVRHYWSRVNYDRFYFLENTGGLIDTEYDGLNDEGNPSHDANFNAFSVDMVYNWQFAPGSFMRVVWKNNILTNDFDTSPDFLQNFRSTLAAPQLNSLSVRLIYYLDYVMVRRWFKN